MTYEVFLKYPTVFAVGFVITYFLAPMVGRIATLLGVVDKPGLRRLNKVPIPRGGGIAVFAGFHCAAATIFLLPWTGLGNTLDLFWWKNFFISSSIILIVGIWDDIFHIRPVAKLLGQTVASVVIFIYGVRVGNIQGTELPLALDFVATVFCFLAFTNAFNLIDGLDGLATGLAMVAALGIAGSLLFRHLPGDALVLLGFIGACSAFLRYNFHPAQIFLGDSGSLFLGFTLAAVSLSTASKGTALATIGVPLLAVGVPIFDTILAVWRRSVRQALPDREGRSSRRGVMSGDMDHLHHRLLQTGVTQRRVAIWLYITSLAIVSIGLVSMVYHSQAVGIYLLSFLIGTYVVVRHVAHVELWDSGSIIVEGFRRPTSPLVAMILYPVFDLCILGGTLFLSLVLTAEQFSLLDVKYAWLTLAPSWCGLPFIFLFLVGAYQRVWSRARISEFMLLGFAVSIGVLLSGSISLFEPVASFRQFLAQMLMYLGLSSALIMGIRGLPRVIQDYMGYFSHVYRRQEESEVQNVLIYGAGLRSLLYLREKTFSSTQKKMRERVVGFIDDDRNLRKRWVHGHEVLGELQNLDTLIPRHSIHEIVITASLSVAHRAKIVELCKLHGVKIVEWSTTETDLYDPNWTVEAKELKIGSW